MRDAVFIHDAVQGCSRDFDRVDHLKPISVRKLNELCKVWVQCTRAIRESCQIHSYRIAAIRLADRLGYVNSATATGRVFVEIPAVWIEQKDARKILE